MRDDDRALRWYATVALVLAVVPWLSMLSYYVSEPLFFLLDSMAGRYTAIVHAWGVVLAVILGVIVSWKSRRRPWDYTRVAAFMALILGVVHVPIDLAILFLSSGGMAH